MIIDRIEVEAMHKKHMSLVICVLAVYCAVGLASYELYDFVDFDNWFTTKLMADLNVSHTK